MYNQGRKAGEGLLTIGIISTFCLAFLLSTSSVDAAGLCDKVKCSCGTECVVRDDQAYCECSQACPKIYAPLCGDDGVTYDNDCLHQAAMCRLNTVIAVLYREPCDPCRNKTCTCGTRCEVQDGKPVCSCPTICTLEYNPRCGSDGVTYGNPCMMSVAACAKKMILSILHMGACKCDAMKCGYYARCQENAAAQATCVCPDCSTSYGPQVCGSDGKTYASECHLRARSCKIKSMLTVKDQGACK